MKALLCLVLPLVAHCAILFYIGGGDNDMGAFDGYINDPNGWTFVRGNANGYYINNFAFTDNPQTKLQKMASLFTNKNAFYETDYGRSTDDIDQKNIQNLISIGFNVNQATVNEGWSASRIQALQVAYWRPVYAMQGPWVIGGDINSNASGAVYEKDAINHMSGSSTDGPLGYWANNTGQMQQGDYSMVNYSHSQNKQAMVMMATYTSGSGDNFLSIGQSCVRDHENVHAIPDIWVISYYAAQLEQYPVTPEQVNGNPAGTVTGLGYWVIHHLQGKALLTLDQNRDMNLLSSSSSSSHYQLSSSSPSVNFTFSIQHNDESWLDICPTVYSVMTDILQEYEISFQLYGKDITKEISGKYGLRCVGSLRLWSGQSHAVLVTLTERHPNSHRHSSGFLSSLELILTSHPKEPERILQRVKIDIVKE